MKRPARIVAASLLGIAASSLPMGCGGANEEFVKDTKGTAAPDAPQSQKEYFEQMQKAQKDLQSKPGARARGSRARR